MVGLVTLGRRSGWLAVSTIGRNGRKNPRHDVGSVSERGPIDMRTLLVTLARARA